MGVGLNLANSTPTVCINDLIREYNKSGTAGGVGGVELQPIGYERLLAAIFNELERLFEAVQAGDMQQLYDLYDRLWLHT